MSQGTVESLAGRQPERAYNTSTAPSLQAAVNRVHYVLDRYVTALVNADADAIREFRTALSPQETLLLKAREVKVNLDNVRIEVNETEATARCRRRVTGTTEAGVPIQEDAPAVYRLVRRPAGWVIVDVK